MATINCPRCNGKGLIGTKECKQCEGTGKFVKEWQKAYALSDEKEEK